VAEPDPSSWMKALGLGWRVRLALKWMRGDMMDFVKKLVAARPGLLRTILAGYIVVVVVLNVLGLGSIAATVTSVAAFLGATPDAAGAPFNTEAVVAAALAFAATARAVLRWFLEQTPPAK